MKKDGAKLHFCSCQVTLEVLLCFLKIIMALMEQFKKRKIFFLVFQDYAGG